MWRQILGLCVLVALGLLVCVGLYRENVVTNSFESLSLLEIDVTRRQYSSGFTNDIVDSLNSVGQYTDTEALGKLEEARSLNEDVIGWISVPEWNIDYPVLLGEDNYEYVRKALDGSWDINGCIFMDTNYADQQSRVKLIHGHNMENDQWFSNVPLLFELEDLTQAPVVSYTDFECTKIFSFISVFPVKTKEESVIITKDWFELTDLEEVKQAFIARSEVPRSTVPGGVEILMLDTCWYGESGAERNLHCVTVAVRVK